MLRIDSAGTGAVLVYNKSGELVDIIEQKDDIIIDCGFYDSSEGDLMWLLTLSTSADTPVTTLTTYSYAAQGGESVATMSGVISACRQGGFHKKQHIHFRHGAAYPLRCGHKRRKLAAADIRL